jgi:hypothetical protein
VNKFLARGSMLRPDMIVGAGGATLPSPRSEFKRDLFGAGAAHPWPSVNH